MKKNPSYAELSALPAEAYLHPENFVTPFDEGTRRAPTKALNRAKEQYDTGVDEGRKGDIHISNQSVWSSARHDGSNVYSYEGIGYHAHTASLLAGFLASGGKVFVHRQGKGATQIAGPKTAKKNGPTLGKPHYPFAEKEKQYAKYTTSHLYHAMNDAMAASRAQQGWNQAGANWYLDDYHTIVKEIQRRKRMRKNPDQAQADRLQLAAAGYFVQNNEGARTDLKSIAGGYEESGIGWTTEEAKIILREWKAMDEACAKPYRRW